MKVNDVLSIGKQQKSRGKRKKAATGGTPAVRRWMRTSEYELRRKGTVVPPAAAAAAKVTEADLWLFCHVDHETCVYGENPKRPLWVGVLWDGTEYRHPTLQELRAIYAKARPAAHFQMATPHALPYWVDNWYRKKERERAYKKRKRCEQNRANPPRAK